MLEVITKRMQERKVGSIVVTTSDGRLQGVLYRKDAEQQLGDFQAGRDGKSE
ncbi:MAG: hypothetical protein ACRDIB_16315 [Ardenticatenaceae bacterium]